MRIALSPVVTLFLGLVGASIFYLTSQSVAQTIWLGIGMLVGLALLLFDEKIGYLWYAESENAYLITRSPLFWLVYLPLALFVVTSAGSALGNGLILGLGAQLWVEMMLSYQHPEQFATRFLTQLSRPLSISEIKKIVGGATALLLLLTLVVVWQ